MATLKTAEVPIFEHDHFAGEVVDTVHFPHLQLLQGGTIPVVVSHEDGGTNRLLSSLSSLHGRSYVLNLQPEASEDDATEAWPDQYGNYYTSVSTKGDNLSTPDILRSRTAPSGFIPYGLQEGDSLLRVLRASKVLRQAGVDTEWTVRITQPKLLVFDSELVDSDTFKRLLLDQRVKKDSEQFNPEDVSEITIALAGMEFFVTYRAMSAAERLPDMFDGNNLNMPVIQKAIGIYNQLATHRKSVLEELSLPEKLNEDDVKQYLGVVLPRLIGYHFGKLHDMNLVHGYPHAGNVNILGGLVDLDSVTGTILELGDEENSEYKLAKDFSTLTLGLFNTYPTFLDDNHYPHNPHYTGRINLFTQYFKQRNFEQSEPKKKLALFCAVHDVTDAHQLYGGGNRSGILAQLIPKTERAIEEFVLKTKSDTKKSIPVNKIARELYWRQIEGSETLIWEQAVHFAGLAKGDEYLLQGRLPTHGELEQGLMLHLGADEDNERPFSNAILQVSIIPYLQENGYFSGDRKYTISLPDKLLRELACTILDIGPEYAYSITPDTVSVINSGVFDKVAPIFLPDFDEFWSEFKQLFRERYLKTTDLSVVQDQSLLTLKEDALQDYENYWFYEHSGISRYFKNVPKEVVENYISTNGVTRRAVDTAEELLQTEYVHDECICLLITDGSFDDYKEEFPEEDSSYSYLQFFDTNQTPSNATYAIFLIKQNDGTFKMEYNAIK